MRPQLVSVSLGTGAFKGFATFRLEENAMRTVKFRVTTHLCRTISVLHLRKRKDAELFGHAHIAI
jgi:hypothetical protein